jgi:hypothetical protein
VRGGDRPAEGRKHISYIQGPRDPCLSAGAQLRGAGLPAGGDYSGPGSWDGTEMG